jgi:Fe-S cluster assembly ATP-binding protein
MLEIKDLVFEVSDEKGNITRIIDNVSITVPDGKFFVITGPNGGGKSTLARLIMGLERPTSGKIIYNGVDITDMDVTERAAQGIGYAFQQPPRFKGMKVRDLLELASGKDKLSATEGCMYLNKVGLCAADYIDREVNTSLSGGEVKRIEIATILARNSSLMIFDEPEAGIDLWSFAKLTETFGELHKNSDATMIIISHQERIIGLADEIVVLSGGQVDKRGTKDEVFPSILAGVTPGCKCVTYHDKKGQ